MNALQLVAQLAPPPPAEGSTVGTVITLLLLGGFVLLLALAGRKLFFKDRGPAPKPKVAPQQEAPKPLAEQTGASLPKVALPPSPEEAAALAQVEAARKEAQETHARREALAAAARAAQGEEKEKLQAQAQALKAAEEEQKQKAYEAKKLADAEEKERKKREKEEAAAQAARAAQQAKEEEARLAAEAKRAQQQRIDAQGGQTLSQGLAKTREQGFIARLNGFFGGGPKVIDEKVLSELEEILFSADIGVKTASFLVELAREKSKKGTAENLKDVIRAEVARIVDLKANHSLSGGGPPHVVMVVGVNGAGKTTTIGKLAAKATAAGKKVVLAAGDTFRAAAAEQLDVWSERAGAILVQGKAEADPSSVVFDGVRKGLELKADLVICDTAGRLHTKVSLMDELKKVRRTIDKALPGAPHEVLLVLDSTNGQNAIAQARQFHEAVGVTTIALTKLDGTAKGGVIIGICDELKLPVAWAGVGEKVADLRPFDPKEFVAALFE